MRPLSSSLCQKALFLPALMVGFFACSAYAESPVQPDPAKTPGDVMTTDAKVICVPGYSKSVRNVPQAIKEQAYRSYGITSRQPGEYEIDHLISLELGGSNSIRNLWPESFITQPLNAHVKDTLENKLHELVCAGQLPLEQAQKEISENWVEAYRKYVGPLPGGVASTTEGSGESVSTPSVPLASTEEVQPDQKGGCPSEAPVKVSKTGIYHIAGDPSYGRTHARHCFATPEAAQAAGFRAPKN